jgi:hypothetical protein
MNFRIFELFGFDSNKCKGNKKTYCSLFGSPLARPKPAGLVAHLKSRGAASPRGAQGGADKCPVGLATLTARTSGEAD